MSISYLIVDDRLRDVRCTRQRCAASLRAALEQLSKLQVVCAPQDRKAALEHEQQVIAEALEKLLVRAVPLQPAMDRVEREQWHVVQASLRDGPVPVLRERNRSVLPRVQPVEEEEELVLTSEEQVGEGVDYQSAEVRSGAGGTPAPEWEEPAGAAAPPVEPEPEPAPELTGWRAARARRLQAAGAR